MHLKKFLKYVLCRTIAGWKNSGFGQFSFSWALGAAAVVSAAPAVTVGRPLVLFFCRRDCVVLYEFLVLVLIGC